MSNKTHNYKLLANIAEAEFDKKCIKLSQMVTAGRLNSNSSKLVFSEMYDQYQAELSLIKKVCNV